MHVHAGLNLSIPHTCPHAHIQSNAHTKHKENPESHGYCNCQGATGGIYGLLILILCLKNEPLPLLAVPCQSFFFSPFPFTSLPLFPSPAGKSGGHLSECSEVWLKSGCPAEQLSLLLNVGVSPYIVKSLRSARTPPKRYSHHRESLCR